jgi:hypothetical protein
MLALRNDSRLSGRPPGTGEKRMLVDRSDPTRREPLARGTAKSCRSGIWLGMSGADARLPRRAFHAPNPH